ncbi:agmatinase [Candidatus Hydrogenisulfobacillus filiaventi]|uniref:Agmatinase n=1 Tax=Candidatus Hydrogenisulfobacillus filiaventi TaxID=2707344 RepID=A0A6F8ZL88_9FIRM|nr:agmatinase [Bacillota bacterium]CAB1130235.1 agmatinase [Candidatus Hydrogenisulfobacillus filiaventi]
MNGHPPLFRPDRFLGMDAAPGEARWVFFGIPMDFTASYVPGSRFGPDAVRRASYALETYSWRQQRDLSETGAYDAGDLELPFGNVPEALERIRRQARAVLAEGRRWCAVGGEHLVTVPLVEVLLEQYPDLVVVHWDAHADLRDTYLDERFSHATALRRVADRLRPGHLYQFGIRSGTAEEAAYIAARPVHSFPDEVYRPLAAVREQLAGRPVYLTVDLDVIDPAYLPGTGTPEPGGIPAREALEALTLLQGLEVVGMDLVEAAPLADTSQRTAVLAAKMVREALIAVSAAAAGTGGKEGQA